MKPSITSCHALFSLVDSVVFRIALGPLAILLACSHDTIAATPEILGRQWPENERVSINQVDHAIWNRLTKQYVDSRGLVDYAKWSSAPEDIAALERYLAELSRAEPRRTAQRSARLAFWINAYNAIVIDVLINQPPIPGQKRSLPEKVWTDWTLVVGSEQYSLAQIEHDELRTLQDPRVHFAIVCGAKGCPRLRSEAYTADSLDGQLTDNSRNFFADPSKFSFDRATNQLKVSPILKWYADDFGDEPSGQLMTILPFLPPQARERISGHQLPTIEYLDYDAAVNEQASPHASQSAK